MSISTTSRREAGGTRDGLAPVARLADDLEIGLGREDHAEPGTHQALVVGEQDADHRTGSRARSA